MLRDEYDVLSPLSTMVNGLLMALGTPVGHGMPGAVLDDREPRDLLGLARTELRAAAAAAVAETPVAVLDRESPDRLALAREDLRAAEAAAREALIERAAAAKLAGEQARSGLASCRRRRWPRRRPRQRRRWRARWRRRRRAARR